MLDVRLYYEMFFLRIYIRLLLELQYCPSSGVGEGPYAQFQEVGDPEVIEKCYSLLHYNNVMFIVDMFMAPFFNKLDGGPSLQYE